MTVITVYSTVYTETRPTWNLQNIFRHYLAKARRWTSHGRRSGDFTTVKVPEEESDGGKEMEHRLCEIYRGQVGRTNCQMHPHRAA